MIITPKKIKLTYLAKKPWLTDGLKISIKRKNALYKIFRQRDTAYNEMQYELYRDKVTKLTKLSEKKPHSIMIIWLLWIKTTLETPGQ